MTDALKQNDAFRAWWFNEETVVALENARTVEQECRLAWEAATRAALSTPQPAAPCSASHVCDCQDAGVPCQRAAPQPAQAVPQPAALTVAEVDKLINTAQELGAARGWDMREKLHYLVHLTNGIKQPGSEAC